jgi:hypothetical protein
VALVAGSANAQREIPDDNLAYPVLITLGNGNFGSGFFLNTEDSVYLVTAKHVLFDPTNQHLFDQHATLLSYSKDLSDPTPNRIVLDFAILQQAGKVKPHPSQDVVVVQVFSVISAPPSLPSSNSSAPPQPPGAPPSQESSSQAAHPARNMLPVAGVQIVSYSASGVLGADISALRTFDKVLVGNEAMVFGYPNSLGLQQFPQLDPNRPLLRKGIVAGTNPGKKSIILDCPVYFGNSGGPVLEMDRGAFSTQLSIIGVVDQYVPFLQGGGSQTPTMAFAMQIQTNSGYSIAIPMDFVLELVR